jgi:hypothetical protein
VQRHAVHRRGHAELADAVIDVAPGVIVSRQRLLALGLGVVRPRQVGRAADGRRNRRVDGLQGHFRRLARRHGRGLGDQRVDVPLEPFVVALAGDAAEELVFLLARFEAAVPFGPFRRPTSADLAPRGEHVVRDRELLGRQPQFLAGRLDLVFAERGAVGRGSALLVGGAIADDCPAADQARPLVGDRLVERASHLARVEPVAFGGVPAARRVAGHHVLVARQIGRAIDGDAVVVPQHD